MIRWNSKRYIKSREVFSNLSNENYFIYCQNKSYRLCNVAKAVWDMVLSSREYEFKECDLNEQKILNEFMDRKWIRCIKQDIYMRKAPYTIAEKFEDNHIMFNTLFGNIEQCSKEIYEALTDNKITLLKCELIDILLQKNYICFNEGDDYEKLVIPDSFFTVYLIFSYACNMSCVYCFEGNKEHKGRMSKQTLKQTCQYINALSKNEKVEIAFYGGEPLLNANKEYITYILERFSNNENVFLKFITNGVNVNQYMELFSKYKKKISGFVITVDGTEKLHNSKRIMNDGAGTYDIIIRSIVLLANSGFRVTIRINVSADTLEEQEASIMIFNNLKCKRENLDINIHQVHNRYAERHEDVSLLECYKLLYAVKKKSKIPVVFVHPFYDVYERVLKGKQSYPYIWEGFCKMRMYRVVDVDGSIYPCSEAMLEKELCMGNVIDSCMKYPKRMSCADGGCPLCDYYLLCYGKCSLQNFIDDKFGRLTCNKDELRETVRSFSADIGVI